MPTYNHEKFIIEAINSVRAQTYNNWELIIINDGSTDNTKSILNNYQLIDDRIKPYHKSNGGTVSALNFGLNKVSGDWIFWLSSDDLYEKNKLQQHFNFIISNNNVDFIHTNHYILDDMNLKKSESLFDVVNYIGPSYNQSIKLLDLNYINGVTISMSKAVFNNIGYFDYSYVAGHDYDYWLRVSLRYKINYLNKYLSSTRIHSGQDTNKFVYKGILDSGLSSLMAIKKYGLNIFSKGCNNDFERLKFIESCLFIILNKSSYVNVFGYVNLFSAYVSLWIKMNFDCFYISNVISQISNNKSFEQLVGFLSKDSDLEYISKNIHPLIFLKEKFNHLHEFNPDLSGDYKIYIDLYMNQKKLLF
jgi:glycosyltransferase involved in cell wall biosynthesis